MTHAHEASMQKQKSKMDGQHGEASGKGSEGAAVRAAGSKKLQGKRSRLHSKH